MGKIFIVFICLATVFLNIFPFFYGLSLTPSGHVYLGTVYYPTDYFYYLSQISQGDRNNFFVDYIWGPDNLKPSLVGWLYVFFGSITHFFHITPIISYQILLGLTTFLYIFSAYLLTRQIFPKKERLQILSLIFFVISSEIPKLSKNGFEIITRYEKPWFSYGDPFVRLDPIPNHLLTHTAILLLFVCIAQYKNLHSKLRYLFLISLAFLSFLLATLHPVQLGVIVLVFGIHLLIDIRKELYIKNFKLLLHYSMPLLIIVVSALPFLLYMHQVLQIPPYSFGKSWEVTVSVYPTLLEFIRLYGSISIIGFLSLAFFLKNKNPLRLLLGIYVVISFLLAFPRVPEKLGIINMRFLSAVFPFILALSAVEGISSFANAFKKRKRFIFSFILLIIFAIHVPVFPKSYETKINRKVQEAEFYIPESIYQAIIKSKEFSTPNEVILAFWPYERILPGLTGRKTFFYNQNTTIEFTKKHDLAYKFVDKRMGEKEIVQFLKTYNIHLVMIHNHATVTSQPFFKLVYKNDLMSLYRVI